ncbi:ABC transporter ATP-binding protein [Galactobacter sp.]|uniref:ABC transporter ATP-binding protein n=1 Tax=Galactobacter sp. TaxID=2676125 RepID=UPI0025C6EB97|nr:ABC transporter ATP-binding protein [Galactobacter sp.]
MEPVIQVRNLTKRYRDKIALDGVDFDIQPDTIYGVMGRNGAGKTTAMSIITAQNTATSGEVLVFGENPYENTGVVPRMCFVRESQRYPDDFTCLQALRSSALFFPKWDQSFADQLVKDFQLPVKRRIKKLSRGQLSAVGVIIGLASRADITFFDEPYLGLDAVARQTFYDHLLTDYAEHPRTVLLSSHLIDEISDLVERVLVLDQGRIIMDQSTDEARAQASTLVGDAATVDRFVAGREVIHRQHLGKVASVTFMGQLDNDERSEAARTGLDTAPVSLQELIVRITQNSASDGDETGSSPYASSGTK